MVAPQSFVQAREFDDFEEYAAVAAGWNLEFQQLDRGAFHGDMTQIVDGPVLLGECRLSRRIRQRGEGPSGCWTFGIPLDPGMRYRWLGNGVENHHVIGFDHDVEMNSTTEGGFHILAVSIGHEFADLVADTEKVPLLGEIIGKKGIAHCSEESIDGLRRLAHRLVREARENPAVIQTPAYRQALQEDLATGILESFREERRALLDGSPRVKGRALRKALAAIEERAHEPLLVSELVNASGASGRTVRYAFEEEFGMSPKAYLQAHRLNRVRGELLRSPPSARGAISDIANAWGFWHLGQFAADYRKMFGELPSDTLSRWN